MENLITFFQNNLSYSLLFSIVLSGIFITKYTKKINIISNTYKVLIASVIISVIIYYVEDCSNDCLSKFIFTYLFATSFYEVIVKWIVNKVSQFLKIDNNSEN